METLSDILSWKNIVAGVAVYFISLACYRLFLHPLARFPGPKLAAITRYYEGYYDVYKKGQYTFKISDMHKRYGPIVRISPYELHVNDPAFFDTLYRQDAHYDKYAWAVDAFAAYGASLTTAPHDLHRARRQPLSPFFSKARVAARLDVIYRHLSKFSHRLSRFAEDGTTFDFGAATTAYARDVANEFILGKSYNSLESDDFDVAMLAASQGSGQMWRLSKFVRFVAPTMRAISVDWMIKNTGREMRIFFQHLKDTMDDTRDLMSEAVSNTADKQASPRTIVHEIMDSKLSPSEKEFDRVFNEVSIVTGAGFETTASVLRLVFFHLFSDFEILERLRAELDSALATTSASPPDLKALEQLPYLTAILKEGLRLSPAIASRMARISPKTDISYGKWCIPAGTPVGMTLLLMHTDRETHPEPMRFNPDRWLEPDSSQKAEKAFAPFSKGTRNCLGMHLAWAEMYILVAAVAQRFNLEFPGSTAEDFECENDSFAIGTRGRGNVKATVTINKPWGHTVV